MHDTIGDYHHAEEDPLKTSSDEEESSEPSTIAEAKERYTGLRERYVTLKTMMDSLKQQISTEREQWKKEVNEVAQMQTQMVQRHNPECGDMCSVLSDEEYQQRMELFKDFVFFKQVESMENIKKDTYHNYLSEVEAKCNLELEKIRSSLIMLKPLQDIASTWGKEEVQEKKKCTCGASGDKCYDEESGSLEGSNDIELEN